MTIHIVPQHDEPDEMPLTLADARARNLPAYEPRPCFVCGSAAVHSIGGRRYCADCAPLPPAPTRVHVTAQMLADVWADGRRSEVAGILAALPQVERGRLETEYLKLLRRRGHRISLTVIKRQFQLVIALPASESEVERAGYVVERLAA